jgi:hypothetical protein
MNSFVNQKKPFVVCVLRGKSAMSDIATILNGEMDGADAFDLHLNWLPDSDRSPEVLKKIFNSTRLPVLALYYREPTPFSDPVPPEEVRLAYQMRALDCGAAGVDIQADLFDPNPAASLEAEVKSGGNLSKLAELQPKELTLNPEAISRQKELIRKIHDMNKEVLLSAHVGVKLNQEQGIALALEMESRGADIVKIVSLCDSETHLIEMLSTISELKRRMKTPFIYLGAGENGRLTRIVGAMLGNALVFANQRYEENSTFVQPLVRSVKTVLNEVRHDIGK